MAKLTLPDVGNILGNPTSAQSRINSNNTLIEQALENTLSLDGTTPNQMGADLDMNGHDLLNVGVINADSIAIAGSEDLLTLVEQAAASVIEAGEKVDEAAAQATIATTKASEAAASAAAAALIDPSSYLSKSGNLAGLADKAVARANLALATVAASGAYSDLAGRPTLGTAAAKNFGTSANNLVALDANGKLPAVDGSLLTGILAGGINNVRLITASGSVTPSAGTTKWVGFIVNGGQNGSNGGAGGNGGAGSIFIADVDPSQKYAATIGATGGATSVVIGGTTYTATNGVVNLPASLGEVGPASSTEQEGGQGGAGPFGLGGAGRGGGPNHNPDASSGTGYGSGGGGAGYNSYAGNGAPGCLLIWEF